jgi:hypothetical protein
MRVKQSRDWGGRRRGIGGGGFFAFCIDQRGSWQAAKCKMLPSLSAAFRSRSGDSAWSFYSLHRWFSRDTPPFFISFMDQIVPVTPQVLISIISANDQVKQCQTR